MGGAPFQRLQNRPISILQGIQECEIRLYWLGWNTVLLLTFNFYDLGNENRRAISRHEKQQANERPVFSPVQTRCQQAGTALPSTGTLLALKLARAPGLMEDREASVETQVPTGH